MYNFVEFKYPDRTALTKPASLIASKFELLGRDRLLCRDSNYYAGSEMCAAVLHVFNRAPSVC